MAVRGFVKPFGFAPKDFLSQTLVDAEEMPTAMLINWMPVSSTALSVIATTGLTLNLTGSPLHDVWRAGVKTDLTGKTPIIKPAVGDDGMYFVKQADVTQMYTTFADFVNGIQTRLNTSAKIEGLVARGAYADSSATLTSHFVTVRMQ